MPELPQHLECHIRIDQPGRSAIDWLQRETGFSRQRLKKTMKSGAVWLASGGKPVRIRRASRLLKPGDELHLYYDHRIMESEPDPAILIADEGAYTIWFKPYGMRSQGSKWGDRTTITRWAEQHLEPQRSAFLVHRLDRAASGVMLVAHSKSMAKAFSNMFAERQLTKTYQVIVHGEFPGAPEGVEMSEPLDGKVAKSHAWRVDYDNQSELSLLKVVIETGRKHQIRRHLAGQGFPILGDRLYGERATHSNLQLQAVSLAFTCPETGKEKYYECAEVLKLRWPGS